MSDREKVFGFVVEQVEFLTFTVAHAVAAMGWRVIIFADPKRNTSKQNDMYIQRISQLPGVSIEMGFQAEELDVLYIELTRLTPRDRAHFYCRRAKWVGIITYCIRSTCLRTALAELMDAQNCLRCVLHSRRFVYLEKQQRIDLFGLLGARTYLGIDVHSDFLLNAATGERMFAMDWDPQGARRYRLSYMGSQIPAARAEILRDVETALQQRQVPVACAGEDEGRVLWLPGNTVAEAVYCQLAAQSDYSLCPPGFVRLTHRVVEVLVRGSIPILNEDELELYDLGLESGKNCIAVSGGRWVETVIAALQAEPAEIVRMRANIARMRETCLTISASNHRICRQLGVD